MDNRVLILHCSADQVSISHISPEKLHVVLQVGSQVVHVAMHLGTEVVNDTHCTSFIQESTHQMGANESCASCHKHFHLRSRHAGAEFTAGRAEKL
jgi:hypothetical protein